METKTLDRNSKEARDIAHRPVGRTWINADGVEQATRLMGAIPWVRVYSWAGAARGVYGVLEPRTWLNYLDGGHELDGLTLAITVDAVEDFGVTHG